MVKIILKLKLFENFFSHLPMGSPPAKIPKYLYFGNELPNRFFFFLNFYNSEVHLRKHLMGVSSEMNFRKHLMVGEFGSSFPNYAETVFFFMFYLKQSRILIKRKRQIK